MKVFHWVILLAGLYYVTSASRNHKKRSRSMCTVHPRLQDKWHFLEQRRAFVRIRARHFVFKMPGSKSVKYKCVKSLDNIYLLRKRNYNGTDIGVLCLGFSYIADHPRAEYSVIRLIGEGDGTHVMSPVIYPKKSKLSLHTVCAMNGVVYQPDVPVFETHAFIRRSLPGCRFAKSIQGRWNYTYQHAKSLEVWSRNSTLHLMNGKHVKFNCDKKEGGIYVFRAPKFVDAHTDGIMCVEFTPMPEGDPYYRFKISRHNSGRVLDNQLKTVPSSKPVYIHVDCDWIGSPARPEFLYP